MYLDTLIQDNTILNYSEIDLIDNPLISYPEYMDNPESDPERRMGRK